MQLHIKRCLWCQHGLASPTQTSHPYKIMTGIGIIIIDIIDIIVIIVITTIIVVTSRVMSG